MSDIDQQRVAGGEPVYDIDQVCQQFELAIGGGQDVDIANYLTGWDEPERSRLASELIGIEIASQRKAGLAVELQDYLDRLPDCRAAVHEAFSAQPNEQTIMFAEGDDSLTTSSHLRHLRFLAEGGLGQVFIAEDETLRRDAAVKLIREDMSGDADSREQFRVEAEVTGRLDHPGIPIVYAIGETSGGRLFYAMQYVRGTRLDKLIRQHHKVFSHAHGSQWFGLRRLSLSSVRKSSSIDANNDSPIEMPRPEPASSSKAVDIRELLEIFISVCHTVGYAHRRGILHRDIKPSNVIHGKFGETVVIDWGLALPVARQGVFKDVAEQTIAPRSGKSSKLTTGCIGTPAFMSPEQATGDVPLTPASDLFSLGALLYCILTGNAPFHGKTIREVRQKAMECDFEPPKSVVENLPAALQAICLKAMRAQISERYRTTHELVDDLRAYLADRPVSALTESFHRQVARWMRHNINLVLGTMLAMLLVAGSIAIYALWSNLRLNTAQQTSAVNEDWAKKEQSLREKSLMMAATLAAKTLANKIDVIYRTLEGHAMSVELQQALQAWNEKPNDESAKAIQTWLDLTVDAEPPAMKFRSWYVLADDATFLARTPLYSDAGELSASVGKVFAFRDYFHGLGQDLPPLSPTPKPTTKPHNSAAIFSTMDQQMTVNFVVPIKQPDGSVIGTLDVCVECREFADLEFTRGDELQLLLVEGRGYPIANLEWISRENQFVAQGDSQWSAGLVLHHQSELYQAKFASPPRVSEAVLAALKKSQSTPDLAVAGGRREAQLFGDKVYVDPLQIEAGNRWLAASCPVEIETRSDPAIRDTGWFVIVQQESVGD